MRRVRLALSDTLGGQLTKKRKSERKRKKTMKIIIVGVNLGRCGLSGLARSDLHGQDCYET
jgi:hypothetical protein